MASRLLALLIASPLFFLLAPGLAQNNQAAPRPRVTVSLPLPREVTDHTDFSGRIEPAMTADATTRVAGEVVAVTCKAGDSVKKGDLLFQLDPRKATAELARAEANAERAQAGFKRLSAELMRVKRLAATGAGGTQEVENASAALADAEALVKVARAEVDLARLNLDATRVLAPITGKLGRPTVVVGSVVPAATPLVTIQSANVVHVTFDIDERTALRLIRARLAKKAVPLSAEIALADEADFPHRGLPELSDLRFNPATATAPVRIALPNPDGILLPGLSARVRLVESKPYKAMMVASRVIQSDVQGVYVLVVNPAGVIERRQIKYGRAQGALVPVTEGLQATDQVILSNAGPLMPGLARGGDPAPQVGMVVDTDKVAMPERATRSESPWDRSGSSPFGKGGKAGGKSRQ